MNLFVPGRICLFGEHSDWAAGYRRINGELERGYTIITGTNQGVFAQVKAHPNKLVVRSTLGDGTSVGPHEVEMEREALLAEAQKGGFFSYAAGVAYQVLTHYRVRGLEIDNNMTDLPIKKGLSSSAAICVLVARAFNRIYDLKMTLRGEMEFAYRGEISTPSRCGRMDQGCAYGNRPILMTYDGDQMDVQELSVPRDLFFVIVDLGAGKDTKEILNSLNHCYPFAENEVQKGVQNYLGPVSAGITLEAVEALKAGDAERIGTLMVRAQADFDRYLQPACPSQLTAPVLHRVLNHKPLQAHIFGGKGVGSQGDGSAQFMCRDEAAQQKVVELLHDDLGLSGLKLVIKSVRRVRRAVIPAAGFGTRLFPATKVVKKELFPVIGRDGICKPAILAIVEEALGAGIEEVAIIVQKGDKEIFEDFFMTPPAIENFNKLSKSAQAYSQYVLEVGRRVTLLTQEVQEGFGHAVYGVRKWVQQEPFLLMLGDHLFSSSAKTSCARQLLDVYDRYGLSVVGLMETPADEVHHFGCVSGMWEDEGILSLTGFVEKPDADFARKQLRVERLPEDRFLSLNGQYVLTPRVFEFLEEHIAHNIRERGEFQLTSCLDRVRQEDGFMGYVARGRRFDIGNPEAYRQTLIDYRNA
jgi:UTP-glucose-1-phosphate uridylyltransferase/mevalonate kinase